MEAVKFAGIVDNHDGIVTAQDDNGLTRVEFRNYRRLAGFYDEMVTRRYAAQIEHNAVIVQL